MSTALFLDRRGCVLVLTGCRTTQESSRCCPAPLPRAIRADIPSGAPDAREGILNADVESCSGTFVKPSACMMIALYYEARRDPLFFAAVLLCNISEKAPIECCVKVLANRLQVAVRTACSLGHVQAMF